MRKLPSRPDSNSNPLKEFQKEALFHLEQSWELGLHKHILVQSPTGSGKSRVFIEFLKKFKPRGILISPLISLARQQQRVLIGSGINSKLQMGQANEPPPTGSGVWIVSPEFLQGPKAFRELAHYQPNFIIVDECHCLWEWGQDFRPAYLELFNLIERARINQGLWLTATLPKAASHEIETRMQLLRLNIEFLGSFGFPEHLELRFVQVQYVRKQTVMIKLLLKSVESGPGVLFVTSRARTEQWQNLLQRMGLSVGVYHAGLSKEERENQEARIRSKKTCPDILVSTSAFGLGMDVFHLKWVLIEGIVGNLLTMCQMMGRVGRSQKGMAYLVWSNEDFYPHIRPQNKNERQLQELKTMKEFLITSACRLRFLRSAFSQSSADVSLNCGQCDSCLD